MDHDRQSGEVCYQRYQQINTGKILSCLIGNWTTGIYIDKNETVETIS